MYLRPVFTETDPARIAGLIRAHPFGLLVTTGDRGMEATHIPFELAPAGAGELDPGADGFVLLGHLAAANPQCAAIDGGQALAVFSGPHAYISPSWYRTGPAVPTWDYAAVHVSGRLAAEPDPMAGLRLLSGHDDQFDPDAMDPAYRARMLAGIRAFRLTPTRVEAQWKMSQNRSAADRAGVAAALRTQQDAAADAVAALIEDTLPR